MRHALILLISIGAVVSAQDSAEVLAQILADKGSISVSELAQVRAAAPSERVAVLAALLQAKGVLTAAEMARVAPRTDVSAQAVARPPQPPSTGSKLDTEAPPVTADSKFPVSVYGTILMNAFYNTAATNMSDVPLFT